jgi:hypothetical protein
MLKIGTLPGAVGATCRAPKKVARGIAIPPDDQRRKRRGRLVSAVAVPFVHCFGQFACTRVANFEGRIDLLCRTQYGVADQLDLLLCSGIDSTAVSFAVCRTVVEKVSNS